MEDDKFVIPVSGDWTPAEYATAAVQSARWVGAVLTLLNQNPSIAPTVATLRLNATMMHQRQPTLFSQALVDELRTGSLLAAKSAGSAD